MSAREAGEAGEADVGGAVSEAAGGAEPVADGGSVGDGEPAESSGPVAAFEPAEGSGPVAASEPVADGGPDAEPDADGGPRARTAEGGLSARDVAVLDIAGRSWAGPGPREKAVRERLGMSPTAYFQLLNALLDDPRALRHAPVTVNRLRAERQRRRERR